MAEVKNMNVGIEGMMRDVHSHLLSEKNYTFQLNGNIETDEYGGIALTNEHSNLLCSKLKYDTELGKANLKVVGNKIDVRSNKIYLFLVVEIEDEEGEVIDTYSEIGELPYFHEVEDNEDLLQQCGCTYENLLAKPLEEMEEIPEGCTYKTLLNDVCNKCLNFDIKHPIKKVEIKDEISYKRLYFTDGKNPPRYLDLDDLEQYKYKIEEGVECDCGDDCRTPTCLDCDKIRIQKLHTTPILKPKSIQNGGRLRLGAYSYAIAYSDSEGNELTDFYSLTNPIKIFEENKAVMEPKDYARNTNVGIVLEVEELDETQFSYYKIISIDNADVNSNTSVFELGVYPISQKQVLHETNGRDSNTAIERFIEDTLANRRPIFKTWEGLTSANGSLFGYGYKVEDELNLQPIASLLGSELKWQSTVATQDLYKDGVATSLYTGYMRDEVYPFSIQFINKSGSKSSPFPLIGRTATTSEMSMANNLVGYKSFQEYSPECADTDRRYVWQYTNTASIEGECNNFDNGTTSVKPLTIVSKIKDAETIEDAYYEIPISDYQFEGLKEYIEEYIDVIKEACLVGDERYSQEFCELVNKTYPDLHTIPNLPFPIIDGDLEPKTCSIPTLIKEEVFINEVENEQYTLILKTFPTEYDRTIVNSECSIYTKTDEGDFQGYLEYMDDIFHSKLRFLDRVENSLGNLSPTNALDLMLPGEFSLNTTFPFSSFFRATEDDMKFFTKYKAIYTPPEKQFDLKYRAGHTEQAIRGRMQERIHNMSLWYRVSKEELFSAQEGDAPSIIFEVTPQQAPKPNPTGRSGSDRGAIEYNPITTVRMSIFKGKNNLTAVETKMIDMSEGYMQMFTKEDFGYETELYIVLEPYLAVTAEPAILGDSELIQEDIRNLERKYEAGFTWFPTGCFEVVKRYKEYSKAIVTVDSLEIGKKETYETDCMYLIPNFNNCEAMAHKYGKFAYTESSETYPNNEFLWDSSSLKIHSDDVNLPQEYYSRIDAEGYYILNNNTDFRCKPIRHFKFPDNNLVPFIHGEDLGRVGETLIYPLGVTIDPLTVEAYLEVALKNNLITQEQYDNIEGFEILRGDRTIHKSILYKGIVHDMYKYQDGEEEWLFRNFPYNSLGENRLLYADDSAKRFIQHPYNNQRNTKFSLIAPEVYSGHNYTGTEVAFEGYQLGYSKGEFNEVEDHPKWVILGRKAEKLASTLATMEVAFERAMNVAKETIQAGIASSGGLFGSGFGVGTAVGAGGLAAVVIINAFMGTRHKYAEIKMKWMDTFKNLGSLRNFANYYSSVGDYNFYLPSETRDNLRTLSSYKYLRPGRIITNDITGSDEIKINNLRRESSVFLSLGKNQYAYNYDEDYINWDNVDEEEYLASRYIASDVTCKNGKEEIGRHIGSPYVSVRNYLPNQYGSINSISWINTNKIFKFRKDYDVCETIFGGDISISKVAFKTKFPLFFSDAMKLGDRVGFNYYAYPNVGRPRFYVSYDTIGAEISGKVEIPFLTSDYNLNCPSEDVKTEKGMYVDPDKKNHKFYLYYYGIANYFVESEINNNFRVAGVEPHEQFYPYNQDYVRMTQENNVSMDRDNVFYYNVNTYSSSPTNSLWLNLKSSFDPKLEAKTRDVANGVVWSRFDNTETNNYDPWLSFRPLDNYIFPTNYGELIDMSALESQQVLARFENQAVVFNAVDTLADRITDNTISKNLGTGGIFETRPMEFSKTDLGETGTQHYSMVQTQFGAFWVDAKRGRVFQIPPGAKQLMEISSFKMSGGPSGMSKWFKRHLPFKVLKKVKGLEDRHIDNHYDSLGMLLWWDSKFNRVFITKRDVVPLRNDILFDDKNGFHLLDGEVTACKEGWTFNPNTEMCEMVVQNCDEKVVDIAFVIDATASQQGAINNIKNGLLSKIVPEILNKYENYRLSLTTVVGNQGTQQPLYKNLVPFSENNASLFSAVLINVTAMGGMSYPEPWDVALDAVLNNRKERDMYGDYIESSITIGNFREQNEKIVILVTDAPPSGYDDEYSIDDWQEAQRQALECKNKGVKVIALNTQYDENLPTGDLPKVKEVLRHYADVTEGSYSYHNRGENIDEGIIDGISGVQCEDKILTEEPTLNILKISHHDPKYFKDVSWTIAYSPLYQCWVSYYDFHPDYALGYNDYFQTGLNFAGEREKGIWSHTLTNKSFQVFYGNKYPWTIEVNNKNEYVNKQRNSVNAWFSSYRYHNDFDFSEQRKRAVNEMYVYNNNNNSGKLVLNYSDAINKTPKQIDGTTQQIPATHTDNQVKVNYVYNRVVNQDNNIPIWNWDENEINKELNPLAVSFKGKRVLERIKGEMFFTRFTQNQTSLFKHVYKWNVTNEEPLL